MIDRNTIRGMYVHPFYSYRSSYDVPEEYVRNITKFIEVPFSERFEIPVCLLYDFTNRDNRRIIGQEGVTLVKPLRTGNKQSRYKSIERAMQDALTMPFQDYLWTSLVKEGTETILYYVTNGMILNADLYPIMVASWEMEYTEDRLRYVRPVLRISPECFINTTGAMEKLIVRKILPVALQEKVPSYLGGSEESCIETDSLLRPIKVEIENIPFCIKEVDTPSISTSNKALLQIGLDNLEELLT